MRAEDRLQRWETEFANGDLPLSDVPPALDETVEALMQQLQDERKGRAEAERQLAFFRAAMTALQNPVFVKNNNLEFVFLNKAARDFFGLTDETVLGQQVDDLHFLPKEERERYQEEDRELLDSLTTIQYSAPFQKADQTQVDALYWSKGFQVPDSQQRGLVGEIVDVTREKVLERKLNQHMTSLKTRLQDAQDASTTDALTKLYNRKVLDREIPELVKSTLDAGQPASILLIDLDNFKRINDSFGHSVGDDVLSGFANAMRNTFRQQDIGIRYGGDEFMLVLPGSDQTHALAGAVRLKSKVRLACPLPDGSYVTLSIGVTQWQPHEALSTVIARADEALYEAKEQGKDRAVAH